MKRGGFSPDAGRAAALTRRECPWCGRRIRPCNLARHIAASHPEPEATTPKEARQLWVKALRSGEYEQTIGHLHDDVGYCCLGVACEAYREVHGEAALPSEVGKSGVVVYRGQDITLPYAVRDWLGLKDVAGRYYADNSERYLSNENDAGASFEKIADIIESEPEGLVSE